LADPGLPEQAQQSLRLAHRNSLRLLKLVNTLLDFSRIEAGRMQAVYEPVDLATLTAELASVFRSAIERAGIELIIDCHRLDQPVYVDREMWEKIVLNLLSNAFKFTLKGQIAVTLKGAVTPRNLPCAIAEAALRQRSCRASLNGFIAQRAHRGGARFW
jgi:signal transduction histidine kinase